MYVHMQKTRPPGIRVRAYLLYPVSVVNILVAAVLSLYCYSLSNHIEKIRFPWAQKKFSRARLARGLLAGCFMLVQISCSPKGIQPTPGPTRRPVSDKPPAASAPAAKEQDVPKLRPRMLASLELTKRAQRLIAQGRPDRAIRMLERAVGLAPANGQNYYYLAEAWLLKEKPEQAFNFNGLASIHLGTDNSWKKRIINQKQRIEQLAGSINRQHP